MDVIGDHEDFAASLLEPEAHIAVIIYSIEKPYSLRDVLHKVSLSSIVLKESPLTSGQVVHYRIEYISNSSNVHTGMGTRSTRQCIAHQLVDSMEQRPVTYADGAAMFRHPQAEAFSETGAHNERDAVDLF